MYWNGKVGSLGGRMLPKVLIILKSASNKNCVKSNFLQKTQGTYMSISHNSGTGNYQKFAIFEI